MTINKDETTPKTFRTKEGYCLVYPDRLVFSKNQDGTISDDDKKDYTGCALFVFAILALFFGKLSLENFSNGHYLAGSMWLLAAAFVAFCLVNSWNSRDAHILKRRDIIGMQLNRHSSVYKNSYLDIFYNRLGKKRDMRVELAGTIKHGDAEARNAIQILTGEGLLVQDDIAGSGMPYESFKIEYQQQLVDFYSDHPTLFDWAEISEIRDVEKEMELIFPKSYTEYLAVAGSGNRIHDQEVEFFPVSKLQGRNKELRKKVKALETDFYEEIPFVTFAFRNGKYLYFRLDGGFDPKVYEIQVDEVEDSGLTEPRVVAASFSEYLNSAIASYV